MTSGTVEKDKILKDMIQNAVHFGHKTAKWNPKMKPYLYGKRQGVHIFDLHKTAEGLEKACEFLKKSAQEGKTILFVGTKPQATQILEETAEACGMPYITRKWIPGLLTNFSTIKKRIKYLKDLKDQEAKGELSKYTKKEVVGIQKTIAKLQAALGGVQEMDKKPDVVLVVDVVRDHIAVEEAAKLRIPIVAIVDSNANPQNITYPVPGNDDAMAAIHLLVGYFAQAIGKKK